MKKVFLLFVSLFLFCFANPVFSNDVSVGASSWYSAWDFDGDSDAFSPGFLFGPVFAFKISDNFSLSTLFLYGNFEGPDNSMEYPSSIDRFDSDIALNYNITGRIKAYCGVKGMGYDYDDGYHYSVGPALGIGATLHLVGNLYLLLNCSGFYSFGEHDEEIEDINRDWNTYIEEYGVNSNISLAYYIAPWATTVTLGGRVQYFQTYLEDGSEGGEEYSDHLFYGATLAIIKTF